MNSLEFDWLTSAMNWNSTMLVASSSKFWYLVPLIVAISLVYGGTRHETLSQILEHSIRSAVWLVVFLGIIFGVIWFSGYGTSADLFTFWDVQLTLAIMAWVFGTLWIAGHVFQTSFVAGLGCVLSGGLLALLLGIQSWGYLGGRERDLTEEVGSTTGKKPSISQRVPPMLIPVILMAGALIWGLIAYWMSR